MRRFICFLVQPTARQRCPVGAMTRALLPVPFDGNDTNLAVTRTLTSEAGLQGEVDEPAAAAGAKTDLQAAPSVSQPSQHLSPRYGRLLLRFRHPLPKHSHAFGYPPARSFLDGPSIITIAAHL